MVDFRADLRGFDETVAGSAVRHVFHAEGLDRHGKPEVRMDTLVDFAHPAESDESGDRVLPDEFRYPTVNLRIFFDDRILSDDEPLMADAFHIGPVVHMFQLRHLLTMRAFDFHRILYPLL
ncbi:hypothetical protein SDC9_171244 [bioreactor metagenome]|uniref:Uncharacterized protein n=1 Tax=bioreactor metagenome TaxID=1076179 RepID=A0A645GAC3_9ZZZZ